jgi:hypothetical protein
MINFMSRGTDNEGGISTEMDPAKAKAEQFIGRLLANPALSDLLPLSKEEQIQQFFKVNGSQLYPTLSSAAFFPKRDWQQIQAILDSALREMIDRELQVQLTRAVENIDFGFVSFLSQGGRQDATLDRALLDFQKKLLKKHEARKTLNGPLAAMTYGTTDRYVDEVFKRREYVHFELTKVQKLRMSKEEIKHLVRASLLLRNGIHILAVDASGATDVSLVVQKDFADRVVHMLSGQLKAVSEDLLRSAIHSNVSFLENPSLETSARFTSIFAVRCHNYRPMNRVDRGADTPDKSWFSIARRNYKYYGFDIKMLDELYKIAGENGW